MGNNKDSGLTVIEMIISLIILSAFMALWKEKGGK